MFASTVLTGYFNPRSPRGERLRQQHLAGALDGISIHAPRVGSDSSTDSIATSEKISIHAPRVGSDRIS